MKDALASRRIDVPGYGSRYENVVDLRALRVSHRSYISKPGDHEWDGNTAAASALLQFWRSPIYVGFPITPSTKWLETIAAEINKGKFMIDREGRHVSTKRLKLLEAEHAVADYLVGAAASCRDLIFSTATSSVGLDHMTETVRSLGASGLGNVMIINVYRATANFPICIEGDPSDTLAHRDSGFIQVCSSSGQQIYDTILQLPAVGMDPTIMTPTMPGYYGIKDSHRISKVHAASDEQVNTFHDEMIPACPYPSLIDGDTAMGNIVTSDHFIGFKYNQKERMHKVFARLTEVSRAFQRSFGRPGLEYFDLYGFDKGPDIAIVAMGPDSGTLVDLLPRIQRTTGLRVGLVNLRLLTPFPSEQLAEVLKTVGAVGVVNNAHHHGRGHLTLDVSDALHQAGISAPVESFFTGLGGANVSLETWQQIVEITRACAKNGRIAKPYHLLHEGRDIAASPI
jgi:pyruvate ferredoxin oxidoreductase alpha subunit